MLDVADFLWLSPSTDIRMIATNRRMQFSQVTAKKHRIFSISTLVHDAERTILRDCNKRRKTSVFSVWLYRYSMHADLQEASQSSEQSASVETFCVSPQATSKYGSIYHRPLYIGMIPPDWLPYNLSMATPQ